MIGLSGAFTQAFAVHGDGATTSYDVALSDILKLIGFTNPAVVLSQVKVASWAGTGTVTPSLDSTGTVLTLTFSVAPVAGPNTVQVYLIK